MSYLSHIFPRLFLSLAPKLGLLCGLHIKFTLLKSSCNWFHPTYPTLFFFCFLKCFLYCFQEGWLTGTDFHLSGEDVSILGVGGACRVWKFTKKDDSGTSPPRGGQFFLAKSSRYCGKSIKTNDWMQCVKCCSRYKVLQCSLPLAKAFIAHQNSSDYLAIQSITFPVHCYFFSP